MTEFGQDLIKSMKEVLTYEMRDELERVLAVHFTSNKQPVMSGDMRDRLTPYNKRALNDAVSDILGIVADKIISARRERDELATELAQKVEEIEGLHDLAAGEDL